MTNKLVNFNNGNLDCYSKSINDFIVFLRHDIQKQIRNCRNNKNYEKYKKFLDELEEKIKDDGFIKKYFNHNREKKNLLFKQKKLNSIIEESQLLKKLNYNVSKNQYSNFYCEYLLNNEHYESLIDKDIINSRSSFDEVLIEKNGNNKIYFEYKLRNQFIYIGFYINDNDKNYEEAIIFDNLKKYTRMIMENRQDTLLNEFKKQNYFHIEFNTNNIKGVPNLYNQGILKKKTFQNLVNSGIIQNEISKNIFNFLNDEINKSVILNDNFYLFLKNFMPKD